MAKRSKKKKPATRGASGQVAANTLQTGALARLTPAWLTRDWLWGLVLFLAVVLVYVPVWWAGYVWDDDLVVTANPVIAGPLGLKEIWTTSAADICPLTLTTFWLEYKMWGAAALPYHLVNVAMHAACAMLLWRVLLSMRVPGAWLGAALWALHPVQVESVAWITEMKNTESGLFFLLAIIFYVKDLKAVQSCERSGWTIEYTLTLLFAALAMTSKSATVILPLVLCLCAGWIKGRWEWRTLLKVTPLLLMSIVAGLATLWTQKIHMDRLVDSPWSRTWAERLVTSGDTTWFYLGKLVWPHPLLAVYPRWNIDAGQWFAFLPLVAAIGALSILAFKRQSWSRPWFFAFAFFLVALLPAMGLLNSTFFRFSFVADHFQYLASMGPLALAGAGIARLRKLRLQVPIGGGVLLLLGLISWQHARSYENEQTLWNDTLAWNPHCWLGENALGVYLSAQGQTDQAIAHLEEALRLNPNYIDAHYNLGVQLVQKGRLDDAIAQYEKAISINPNFARGRTNLGTVLTLQGKTDEAMSQFEKALEIDPESAEAHYNLSVILSKKGDRDAAIAHLQSAIRYKPGFVAAHSSLGIAYAQTGRMDEAMAEFRKAIELDPQNAEAQNNLGTAFAQIGQANAAISHYQDALSIKPDYGEARDNLGNSLLQAGRFEEAIAAFQEALRLNPTDNFAQKKMAVAREAITRPKPDQK